MDRKISTDLIHTGDGQFYKEIAKGSSVPEVLPLYMTSVFAFDEVPPLDAIYEKENDGYIYSRMRHPNTDAVSQILAKADGSDEALVFSSGMAAITTSILSVVGPGDHIISSPVLYGGVYDFLANEAPRLGIRVSFVDFIEDSIEKRIQPNTKLLYTETISNPLMAVPDIRKAGEIAHKNNMLFFIDNTFATPVIAKPLALGADAALYSATKYLGGHSDIIAGAVTANKEIIEKIRKQQILYGCGLGAFDSWVLARSLRTLDLRMKKHSENALKAAMFLQRHPKVTKVFYPGLETSPDHQRAKEQFNGGCFGGMLSINLDGGEKEASFVIKAFDMIKFVPSLAGTATTLSYAAKTSHRAYDQKSLDAAGITWGQLRLSVGLEDTEDIIQELDRVLNLLN